MGDVTGAVLNISLYGSNEVKQFVLERKLTAGEIEKLKSAGLLTQDGIISIKTQANLIKFDRICGTSFAERLDSEETVGNISAIAGALTQSLDGLMGKKPSEMSLIELASLALIINLLSSQDKERLSRELKSRLDTAKIQEIQKKFFTAVKAAAEQLQSAQSQIKAETTQSIIGLATSVAGSVLGIGASSVSAISSGKARTQDASQQFTRLKQADNTQQKQRVQHISDQLKAETSSLKTKDLPSQSSEAMKQFDEQNTKVQKAQKDVDEAQKAWESEADSNKKQIKEEQLSAAQQELKNCKNNLKTIAEQSNPPLGSQCEYQRAKTILAERDLEFSQSESSISKNSVSELTKKDPSLKDSISKLDSALKSGDQYKIEEAQGNLKDKIGKSGSISDNDKTQAQEAVDAYVNNVNDKRETLNKCRVEERNELERLQDKLTKELGSSSDLELKYKCKRVETILAERDLEISQSESSISKNSVSELTKKNSYLGSSISELDLALKSGDKSKIDAAKKKLKDEIDKPNFDGNADDKKQAKLCVDIHVSNVNAKRKALSDCRVDERDAYIRMECKNAEIDEAKSNGFIDAQKDYLNEPSADNALTLKKAKDELLDEIESKFSSDTSQTLDLNKKQPLIDQTQYAYLEAVSSKQSPEDVTKGQESIRDEFTKSQSEEGYVKKIDGFDKQIAEAYKAGNKKEAIKLTHEKEQYEAQKKLDFAENEERKILGKYGLEGGIKDDTDLTHLTSEDQGRLLGALELKGKALEEMLNINMYSASEHQYKSALAGVAQSFASMFQQSGAHLGSLIAVGDKMTASIKQYESSVTQASASAVDTVLRSLDEFRSTVDSGKSRGLADMEKAVQMYQSMVLEYINTLKSIISLI